MTWVTLASLSSSALTSFGNPLASASDAIVKMNWDWICIVPLYSGFASSLPEATDVGIRTVDLISDALPFGKMAPDEDDKKDLAEPRPGINPEVGDLVRVIDVDAGKNAGPASVDDVDEQQIRDR